jgi:glucose/arabinose dehydrogenase
MSRCFVPLLFALVSACGGGGSGGSRAGLYQVVDAFPNLSFASPLALTYAPGDATRLFVAEQRGTIQVFANDSATMTKSEFLDIQDKVEDGGEKGLLGLAFDPAYASNGFFYVYYSAPGGGGDHRSIVARYQVSGDPDVADEGSETILLQFEQPFGNHNGGCLQFGPDGHLYIASGDGGSGGDPFGNGQSLTTVLGKILRITKTGGIPADNPFVGMGGGVRGEIWAYGMRNPWRFGFDRATGDLWCGDVGQGAFEEVDIIVKGGNYGWNLFEGNADYDNPTNVNISTTQRPVVAYGRALGSTVTGGYVYRGPGVPSLQGSYVYGDFGSGRLWALVWNGAAVVSNTAIASVGNPSSFGEDAAGELYICSFNGSIYRFAEIP